MPLGLSVYLLDIAGVPGHFSLRMLSILEIHARVDTFLVRLTGSVEGQAFVYVDSIVDAEMVP